jgi:hypothetical protein
MFEVVIVHILLPSNRLESAVFAHVVNARHPRGPASNPDQNQLSQIRSVGIALHVCAKSLLTCQFSKGMGYLMLPPTYGTTRYIYLPFLSMAYQYRL